MQMKSNVLKMKVLEGCPNKSMDLQITALEELYLLFKGMCYGAIDSHSERH